MHVHKGDLILDGRRKAVPYAVYVATEDIMANPPADISLGGECAYYYYLQNIDSIQKKFDIEIPESAKEVFYNALYIECFSALELFLSDYVLCKVFSSDEYYAKAQSFLKRISKKQDCTEALVKESDITEKKIRDYFTSTFVFHQFKKAKCLFDYLGLKYPVGCDKDLQEFLYRRNNIVHRFSISNLDRMQVTYAAKADIEELLSSCNSFVSNIINLNS